MGDGPKTVQCSVCGAQVSKRQTVSIGEGKRACRSHEGIEASAKVAQQKVQKTASQGRTRKQRPERDENWNPRTPHCWSCGSEGLHSQQWYLQILVLQEKYELTYGQTLNMFDPEECRKAYASLKDQCCIYTLPFDKKVWFKKRSLREMAEHLVQGMLLCAECCRKYEIDPLPHMKDVSVESLGIWAYVYDSVKPILAKAAKQQIELRN